MKRRGNHEESIVLGDFNAQLGYVGAGEEDVVGEHVFQKVLRDRPIITNRELFMEYCNVHDLRVANTFFNYPDDCLVSFFHLTTKPMAPITPGGMMQIDFVLCSQEKPEIVFDCWTS